MLPGFDPVVTTGVGRLIATAVVATLAFAGAYAIRRIRSRLDDHVAPVTVDLIGSTLSIGIVLGAVVIVADLWGMLSTLEDAIQNTLQPSERAPQLAVTVVVLIAVQVFARVARRLLRDLTRERDAMSEHQREVTYRVTQLMLWTLGLLIVMGVWGVSPGGLLVGAGFLGIVLGTAARQTLGSMLAGFVLMFSRPFEIGDWVAIGEEEGVVTDITVMNTRIQAFDGESIVVPNDFVGSEIVRNKSRKGRLRIPVQVGVDYTADVERARELVTEAIGEVDMIMDVPRPETVSVEFGESAVVLEARGWIDHPSSRRRWRARTRMIRAIKERFAAEGMKIPFPQREVSGREEHGGLRVARSDREGVRDGDRASDTAPDERDRPDGARSQSSAEDTSTDGSRSDGSTDRASGGDDR